MHATHTHASASHSRCKCPIDCPECGAWAATAAVNWRGLLERNTIQSCPIRFRMSAAAFIRPIGFCVCVYIGTSCTSTKLVIAVNAILLQRLSPQQWMSNGASHWRQTTREIPIGSISMGNSVRSIFHAKYWEPARWICILRQSSTRPIDHHWTKQFEFRKALQWTTPKSIWIRQESRHDTRHMHSHETQRHDKNIRSRVISCEAHVCENHT